MVWSVARGAGLDRASAADVCQTTWLRLVEHIDEIREADAVSGWLATVARRESWRVARRRNRVVLDETAERIQDEGPGPEESVRLTDERDRILWACLDELRGRCRTLLRMLSADPPAPYAAIAEALDIPMGSIGPTRKRCLDQLRGLAEKRGITTADLDS
ncbi:MAG: sigma-70 family RNA polymerase sigma factor [Acidimicrobiia bacterium]|nr:sigma-70 family RNA polymerase sigma factor [Acidimicrobiia bacterium]